VDICRRRWAALEEAADPLKEAAFVTPFPGAAAQLDGVAALRLHYHLQVAGDVQCESACHVRSLTFSTDRNTVARNLA
jgi:hypothetical protein